MLLIQKLVNPLGNSSRYLRWNSVCLAVSTSTRNLHLSRPNESAFGEDAKNALRNFGDIKHAPIPALTYGIGGLFPFTAIPVYMLSSGVYIPEMAFTSMAYSAVILSFIGGVRWGSAVSNPEIMNPNWKNFTTSIAPSIVGWMSLLVSNPIGTLLSISGFSLCLLQDMTSSQFPSWYKSLRILLSTVAICALLTTFMCQFLLPLEPKKE
ncbi:transmembrane protein 69-like [Daphnia pulex]|uniref:transmembrane protein 69-like n=1 Tax=Daphnia pulex TaxID=6669 RepID=UPI001EDF67C4|nr:transmembrane protein 69-like [Daphnia pulex]